MKLVLKMMAAASLIAALLAFLAVPVTPIGPSPAIAGGCGATTVSSTPCVVYNPPRIKKKKVARKVVAQICQTRCLSHTEWAWVKRNRNGCWFATSTEGFQTPLFYARCGTHCARPGTNDWGYTENTTGRHFFFRL